MTRLAKPLKSLLAIFNKLCEKLGVIGVRMSLRVIEAIIQKFTDSSGPNATKTELSRILLGTSPRVLQLATSINKAAIKCNPYLAAFEIDKILSDVAPSLSSSKTFYIEAGCNDGIKSSNTIYLETIYGAKGLLVEASASLFELARQNRSDKNIFEHAALCAPEDNDSFMEFIYCDLMTVSTSNTELDPLQHVADGNQFSRTNEYRFLAPTKTLDSLIEKYHIRSVNLLSLDLEGGEIQALRGAVETLARTEYLIIESRSPEELKEALKAYNFFQINQFSHLDYLFKNTSFCAA